jgi:hypothetical protein
MRTTRTNSAIGGVACALVALTLGACRDDGGDGGDAVATEPAAATGTSSVEAVRATGTDDEFCGYARAWAAHELVDTDFDDPALFAAYWPEYVAFVEAASASAPAEIADAYESYAAVVADMTVVFERYDFDGARFEAEGTPEEQEIIEPTDPELQAANEAVLAYESSECLTGQPPAADVSFAGDQPGAYCDTVAEDEARLEAAVDSNFDPEVVEALVSDPEGEALHQQFVTTAPEVIRDDVEAVVAWWNDQQQAVLEAYGYDFRRVLVEASDEELADFQLAAPEIREQFARTIAYEEQVCGF